MADEDHEDDGGAAQAFAALQAEVIVMRRAMEGLPAIIKRMETPDYAPSFGAVIKSLTATEARLAAIEGHPALKLTPDQHASAMKRAGADIMGDAARALRDEADEVARERRNLADIVGEALAQEAQKRALLWTLGLRRRRRPGIVPVAWSVRAGRELSGDAGDGERRPLAGRRGSHAEGRPGRRGDARDGLAAHERQRRGAASLLGGGEEGRQGAEMHNQRAGADAVTTCREPAPCAANEGARGWRRRFHIGAYATLTDEINERHHWGCPLA